MNEVLEQKIIIDPALAKTKLVAYRRMNKRKNDAEWIAVEEALGLVVRQEEPLLNPFQAIRSVGLKEDGRSLLIGT